MAAQVYQPQVLFQPRQPESPLDLSSPLSQMGAQLQSLGQGYLGQASAYFDQAISQYNKIAEQNAQDDAYGIVQRDGNGQIIPPSTFYPSGIHSLAYSQAFKASAQAIYRQTAADDYTNHSALMGQKFPNDPVAYSAAMEQKRQQMLEGLAPDQRPFMDLRFQQIAAQGASRIAVSNQAALNKTNEERANEDYNGIVAAGRQLVSASSQFGIAQTSAKPGLIQTVIDTLPPGLSGRITSADRTPDRNTAVGGAPDSAHLKPGSAIDIGIGGMSPAEVTALSQHLLKQPNVSGIGFYGDHIHVDTAHQTRTVWGTPPADMQGDVKAWQGQTGMAGGPPNASLPAIQTTIANASIIQKQLDDWAVKQINSGTPPAVVERMKQEFGYNVWLSAQGETIKSMGTSSFMFDPQGRVDQKYYANAQEKIRAIAQTYPARAPQIEDKLNKDLSYAINQNQMRAQSQQLAWQRQGEAQAVVITREQYRIQTELRGQPEAQVAAQRALEDSARATINDPTLGDAAKLRLGGMYMQAGQLSLAAYNESQNNAITDLRTIVRSSSSTVDQRERAYSELLTMGSDPNVTRYLNGAQKAAIQEGIDYATGIHTRGEYVGMLAQANTGRPSPEFYQSFVARLAKENKLGDGVGQIPETAALQLVALGTAKHEAFLARENAQVEGTTRAQNHQEQTPTTQAALEAIPYPLPAGRATPDVNDPAEHDRAFQRFLQTGSLPKQWKDDVFGAMPKVLTADSGAPYMTMRNRILGQLMNKEVGWGLDAESAQSKLGTLIGVDKAKQLQVIDDLGWELGSKTVVDNATAPSKSGSAGGPTQQTASTVDNAIDSFFTSLPERALSGDPVQRLLDTRLAPDYWRLSPQERAARDAYATNATPATLPPDALSQLIGTNPIKKVTVSPEVRADLAKATALEMSLNGPLHKVTMGDKTPEESALRDVYWGRKNLYQMVPDKDGNLEMRLRNLDSVINEKMGRILPEQSAKGMLFAIANEKSPGIELSPNMNWQTIRSSTEIDANGSTVYRIFADTKAGEIRKLAELAPNDPVIGETKLRITDQVDRELQENWHYKENRQNGFITYAAAVLGNALILDPAKYLGNIRTRKIESLTAAQLPSGFASWWARQLGDVGDYIHGRGGETGSELLDQAVQAIRNNRDQLEGTYIKRYGAFWDLGHQIMGTKDRLTVPDVVDPEYADTQRRGIGAILPVGPGMGRAY